jgi:1-deoxy-D-xylulose-5-phosphate reductoisomerase
MKKKKITILGSTGSIGTQTLDVIEHNSGKYAVNFLTTNTNIELLEQQCQKFSPKGVVIYDEPSYNRFRSKTFFKGKILLGDCGLIEAASDEKNDLVVVALVGFAGVNPTLAAIKEGTTIALANKETLVTAGEIITKEAKKHKVSILPVDSEHSAIYQCLQGEKVSEVEKIILTASGGPFFKTPMEKLHKITPLAALKHPTWKMGKKVTIDSATMMNKGFEVIEAYWLFGLKLHQIDVVIHPQSLIHSMIQFVDGSIKAQISPPDMRLPISYSLSYPRRVANEFPRIDFNEIHKFSFEPPDKEKFKCLQIAYSAIEKGGNMPAIVNAANEIAVAAFLNGFIGFLEIPELIIKAMIKTPFIQKPTLFDIIHTNIETRNFISNLSVKKKIII